MKKQIKDLEKFQKAFKTTFNDYPEILDEQTAELRFKLLQEENEEYLEAVKNEDLVEILDAITDQLFLVLGTAVSHGLQDYLLDAFNEVMKSNMSKLGTNGKPIINGEGGYLDTTRPLGKILKSVEYHKPDLKKVLEEVFIENYINSNFDSRLNALAMCDGDEIKITYCRGKYMGGDITDTVSIDRLKYFDKEYLIECLDQLFLEYNELYQEEYDDNRRDDYIDILIKAEKESL